MASKTIYQRLFDESPLARLVITRDGDNLKVSEANEAAGEYFATSAHALKGSILENLLEAANKAHIIQAFSVCFSSAVPISIQLIPMLPGAIRIQSFLLNPILDEQKTVIAIDMMARPPASDEDALRRERDDAVSIFASVFDASDVGIVVTDHHRRIVRVNATFCRTYGWDAIDLVGQEFTMLIPEDEHGIARSRHDNFMGDVTVEKSRELKIYCKDGSLANIIASSGVIELSAKRKFRISTVVNITPLKKIERDLRRAKEVADAASLAKSSFLANMSHELRTPLNAIIGFSDLMITGTLGPIENPNYRGYMDDIKFSAAHLLAIINDVLDMSKIEAGHMTLSRKLIDIVPVLDESLRLMRARAQESAITLEMHTDGIIAPVSIDERIIRQVILNLLSNAIKFSHDGSKVTVDLLQESGDLVIRVTDNGIGIPADKMDEVMMPFGQVSDPRVNKGQGTGLGLPLARAMVELHGGRLEIQSTADVGTIVSCYLPLN